MPVRSSLMFASVLGLSAGELVLVLVVILVLFATKRIPDFSRGLWNGLSNFRNALDCEAHDAGKSLGGIYGKPAAQALTHDNQIAELYEPSVFGKRMIRRPPRRTWFQWCRFWKAVWRLIFKLKP